MLPRPNPELAVAFGLFSVRQAREAGYSTAEVNRLVRKGRWTRLGAGCLLEANRDPHDLDDLVHSVLSCGPGAVVSHRSAAVVHGWALLGDPKRPEVTVPNLVSSHRVRQFRTTLTEADVQLVGILPVTVATRTALDIAATNDLLEAVVALDSALRARSLTSPDLEAAWLSRRSMHGRGAARGALDLASPCSESVPETELRVRMALAGLPAPVLQYEVTVDGAFIARADFAWPEHRLIVEVDGYEWHGGRRAFQSDHARIRALTKAGWTVLCFTADDVRQRPDEVLQDIASSLA